MCLFGNHRNLDTGQLLQKVLLGDGFSHVACLRGYSYSVSVCEGLMRRSAGSLDDFYLPVLHREYYLSCCSIGSSAPTRK